MSTFFAKLNQRAAQTGKSFHELCREMGRAGGRRAARHRRLRKQALACKVSAIQAEKLRQVAMGVESADAVGEPFTAVDRKNIAREAQTARLRVKALEGRA